MYEKYLEQIIHISKSFRIDSLESRIAALNENIREGDSINVALLGRFKAGKSSFLNSLIGRNIMPVAVLPLTSVVTYVKYGPTERAEIQFHNGQVKSIALEKIADYITEKGNPKNIKKVARVDIELPDLHKLEKIRFVDTPGVGSAYVHNTITSTEWLPKVGAAFLAISVDRPLSEEDISLLKELGNHTSEIIILLTKVDLVSQKETGEVIDFIHRQVKEQLNKKLPVFPFSNKPGYESQRTTVYEFIFRSIVEERTRKSEEITGHKLRLIVSNLLEYLELASLAADSAQISRQELRLKLRYERENLSAIENEIKIISDDIKSRLYDDSYERFQKFYPDVRDALIKELKERMLHWKKDPDEIFREWIKESLTKRLETISEEIGPGLSKHYLDTVLTGFSRVVRAFQDRLADDIKEALHTKFAGAVFEIRVERPKEPDLHITYVLTSPWGMLLFAMPVKFSRPLISRHFIERIPWETEKNLSRLSSQWAGAISSSIDDMAKQAIEFINNEIVTVENIMVAAPDRKGDIKKAISDLKSIEPFIRS